MDIFPAGIARKEVAYYKTMLQPYGLPLDSRTRLTKTDWCAWSATLANNRDDFQKIVDPIYDYLNTTTARLPFVDSYQTDNPRSDGMRARPVIGGLFIKMLEDKAIWKKWASRDRTVVGRFAGAPQPPRVTEVVATSRERPATWRYTLSRPPEGWATGGFDDREWSEGAGGFGTKGTPGAVVRTTWNSPDIWLRREITLPAVEPTRLQLVVYHDEDAEIYLDGVLAASETGYVTSYQLTDIRPEVLKRLKPGGKFVLAVHCHQTGGGQGVDVGLADVVESER
jgi:hypothetical protein